MVAVVLLQTIGLFHQRMSSLYHEMWVMVRPPVLFSSGLELTWFSVSITHKNAACVPPDINNYGQGSLDTLCHELSLHETTKRLVSSENSPISHFHLITEPSSYPISTIYVTAFAPPCIHPTSHRQFPCGESLWKTPPQ